MLIRIAMSLLACRSRCLPHMVVMNVDIVAVFVCIHTMSKSKLDVTTPRLEHADVDIIHGLCT